MCAKCSIARPPQVHPSRTQHTRAYLQHASFSCGPLRVRGDDFKNVAHSAYTQTYEEIFFKSFLPHHNSSLKPIFITSQAKMSDQDKTRRGRGQDEHLEGGTRCVCSCVCAPRERLCRDRDASSALVAGERDIHSGLRDGWCVSVCLL